MHEDAEIAEFLRNFVRDGRDPRDDARLRIDQKSARDLQLL